MNPNIKLSAFVDPTNNIEQTKLLCGPEIEADILSVWLTN